MQLRIVLESALRAENPQVAVIETLRAEFERRKVDAFSGSVSPTEEDLHENLGRNWLLDELIEALGPA